MTLFGCILFAIVTVTLCAALTPLVGVPSIVGAMIGWVGLFFGLLYKVMWAKS